MNTTNQTTTATPTQTTPDQTNHAAAIRLTPTEQLGRLVCHAPIGVAVLDRYIYGGEGLAPLHSLAAGLQTHLDKLVDLTHEKRALGQRRIDALRAVLATIEAQPDAEREAHRRIVQKFPAYQANCTTWAHTL